MIKKPLRGNPGLTAGNPSWIHVTRPRGFEEPMAKGIQLLKSGKVEEAKFEIAAAFLADWDNPDTQLRMGEAMLLSGRPGSAVMYIDSALRLKPDHAEAKELKASAIAAQEKKAEEKKGETGDTCGP